MEHQLKRILLADDDEIFAKVVRLNLEAAGFSVTVALDGNEALQLAQQDQFDLVITDYQMPNMVGTELCRRLRRDDRYACTPMILISAFDDLTVVELIDDLDLLEAIVVKPFPMSELISRIRECLSATAASP